MIRTRHIAMVYLPTVGVWSLVRAIQFYRCGAGKCLDKPKRWI